MQIPTQPFVTITPPVRVSPETMIFEMWFHVDQTPDRDENRIQRLKANSEVLVFGEEEGTPTPEPIKIASIVPQPRPGTLPPTPQHNVFNLQSTW